MDADELVSAALLGIGEAASRFDGKRGVRFSTFAERRIVGRIKDHFRKQSHGLRGTIIDIAGSDSLESIPAKNAFVAGVESRDILSRLKVADRTTLIRHYIYGYSAAEISRITGIKEGTVDRQIERAVHRARTA